MRDMCKCVFMYECDSMSVTMENRIVYLSLIT